MLCLKTVYFKGADLKTVIFLVLKFDIHVS